MDLAEPRTFAHLNAAAIERAARRWLSPGERAWCAAQPSFREAMVTVLSCKESVCKVSGGSVAAQEVAIVMEDGWPRGWARAAGADVVLWWDAGSEHILTVAVGGADRPSRRLLDRIIGGRRTMGPG